MGYEVGVITEVKGLSVKAVLNELLPPFIVKNGKRENAPKINGYVKTRVGIDSIICQVIGEYNDIYSGKKEYYLELQVRGNITGGRFIQGLRMLPIVSAKIETLDELDYELIYHSQKDSVLVGYDLFDEKKEVKVNVNDLIPSHVGVFGNTGSGKSNTLTKILYEYTCVLNENNTNRGKYIVFDINNEYSSNAICVEDQKTVYHLSTRKDSLRKIPLNLNQLSEDEFITLLNASEKTQVPVIKSAYKHTFDLEESHDSNYYLSMIKSILKNGRKNLFFSLRYHLSHYIKNIDKYKYHNTQGCFYYENSPDKYYANQESFDSKLSEIKIDIPTNVIDKFIFELYFSIAVESENGVQLDFMMPLISRANKLFSDFKKIFDFENSEKMLFDNKNVCIIQLGNVNKDMKEIVPAIISEHVFNKLADRKENTGSIDQIINIVIDEAHNILYEDSVTNKAHTAILNTFEKIVKEGRKFGCFLMISSQRPSDISQTIISQLHNYFIHKLVNPGDISKIRNAVAYLDENALDFITVLAPGECIVSGIAFQMPTFICVNIVDSMYRPNSENVKLLGSNGLFNKSKLTINEDL